MSVNAYCTCFCSCNCACACNCNCLLNWIGFAISNVLSINLSNNQFVLYKAGSTSGNGSGIGADGGRWYWFNPPSCSASADEKAWVNSPGLAPEEMAQGFSERWSYSAEALPWGLIPFIWHYSVIYWKVLEVIPGLFLIATCHNSLIFSCLTFMDIVKGIYISLMTTNKVVFISINISFLFLIIIVLEEEVINS